MKNSEIILIQLIDSRLNKLYITENIKFRGFGDAQETITAICWLPNLGCYVEGTNKGRLKVKNLLSGGECML
jgi:hypothetical protein